MGIRFLIVVVSFVCVSINTIYADTTANRDTTIDSLLSKINSKVRKSKNCENINQYLAVLKNLKTENRDYLTQEHQEKINTLLRNKC